MKTILATTALALTVASSAASAREITAHIIHSPKGTTFPIGTTLALVPASCSVKFLMNNPTGKILHFAGKFSANQETPGCWYSSGSDYFEVNLPGVTNGWQKMPRGEFTDKKINFGP